MAVNAIGAQNIASPYTAAAVKTAEGTTKEVQAEASAVKEEEPAAVYTPSNKFQSIAEMSAEERASLVEQLKEEAETQAQRLIDLVMKSIGKQSGTSALADGESIWDKLRTGQFTVDAQTQKEAQESISEDGYWGVEKTSDRIVKFAVALTGGDPSKLDTMIEAFKKGYDQAEEAWGGELPEIAQRTREAVLQKFQDLKDQAASSYATGAIQTQSGLSALGA